MLKTTNKNLLHFIGAAALSLFALMASEAAPWREYIIDDAGDYFRNIVLSPTNTPIAFTYGGKNYVGLGAFTVLTREITTHATETTGRMRVKIDDTLIAEIEGAYRPEFGETEYVLRFENPGKSPSKVLSNIVTMRYTFEKCDEAWNSPWVYGIRGDHVNRYCPYRIDCWNQPNGCFITGKCRPTHMEFPYFNIQRRNEGILCAIGWAGNWKADFDNVRSCPRKDWKMNVDLRACPAFAASLVPGENIRNARVVLIPYRGTDPDHIANLWRAWFRAYNEPKWNAAGDPLRPFTSYNFALDSGRHNSDGSISEWHKSWKPTLDKIIAEKIVPDFRWFDAGWYFDPRGKSIPVHWYDVGSLELDTEKWPNGSLRASVDAGHAVGMRTLVWFEPERVCDPPALATNYGYKTEWALPYGKCFWNKSYDMGWNNIGDPDCRKWTLDRILTMMDANHIDFYREDHNWEPEPAWIEGDRRSEEKFKVPRRGMTETLGVMGHWALWDAIIEHARQHNRCTFVDSCASGGGRNDLESLRRAFPLMRSDADRTTTALRLSMTSSFCRWIPFHGSGTKEVAYELDAQDGPGSSPYVFRASFLPICNCAGLSFTHNPKLDYNLLRRNLAEWRSVSDLLLKDFYVLTSWHPETDTSSWTVFAYDDSDKGESIVLAFRQETAPYPIFEAQLKFARPEARYRITNADTGKSIEKAGRELLNPGLLLELPTKKSSMLLRLKRL